MSDQAYTRSEIEAAGNALPTRGVLCSRCGATIPSFRDLAPEEEQKLLELISREPLRAIKILREITGCSIAWGELWVSHGGQPHDEFHGTVPCPHCGRPLRSSKARQCRFCKRDWHDPGNVRNLVEIPPLTSPEPPMLTSAAPQSLSPSEELVEWLVPLAGWLFLAGIAWLVAHSVIPALKVDDPRTIDAYAPSRAQLLLAVSPTLTPDMIRFDQRRAGNVVVYIESERFQSIPFPDREGFVRKAAHAWCSNLRGSQLQFLLVPTVRFRDVRSGDSLASYTCLDESWTSLQTPVR